MMTRTEQTDPPVEHPHRWRTGVLWFIGAAIVPLIAAIFIVLKPTISSLVVTERDTTGTVMLGDGGGEILPDSLRNELERVRQLRDVFRSEEAFLLTQEAEATYPRSALWLDFRDSTAILSIQGVPVRTCKIEEIRMSALFGRQIRPNILTDDQGSSFRLITSEGSVPRIPMRHVQAPKDTAEARLAPPNAFVAVEENVKAKLHFDPNLVLYLTPVMGENQWLDGLKLSLAERRDEAVRTLDRFFGRDSTPPERWIRIRMASNDIRAIYRALPDGGKMAIRW